MQELGLLRETGRKYMIEKTGIFSVVGRPNVGKSTLTNTLCGTKVAIVSNKPQTTRNRITGVRNDGECQLVFLDTPGLHKARNALGDYMVQSGQQDAWPMWMPPFCWWSRWPASASRSKCSSTGSNRKSFPAFWSSTKWIR